MKSIPVLITIDVEGHRGQDPVEKLILGNTSEGYYGIPRMMEEFDREGIKALFFVDFAEAWDYGEEQLKKVIDLILLHEHDIGVHLHPDHMNEDGRLFLYEYSYEEQYDLISKCTKLYEKLVGKKPLAFRAGKYGANRETLDILCELGYKYDFSEFYHQSWCGIKPPITINAPCHYKGLIEFPVTMHRSVNFFNSVYREDKFDIEGMTFREIKYALKQIEEQDINMVLTVFLHSFSLINWRNDPDHPVPNRHQLDKMKKTLKLIKQLKNFEFIREKDLKNMKVEFPETALKSEIIWRSNLVGMYYTYLKAKRIYKTNKKAKFLVYMVRFLGATILAMILILSVVVFKM